VSALWRKLTERLNRGFDEVFGKYMPKRQFLQTIERVRTGEKLPLEPSPSVSIVIPVYNGLDYTRECIESIYNSPTAVRFEVIVIDQNSQDGAREMLQEMAITLPNFRLIENSVNVGFGRAINQGAAIARGEFLAISNSDLVMTPGWLDPLVHALRNDHDLAVVSPMTNYVGEGPQIDPEAGDVTPQTAPFYAQRIAGREGVVSVVDRLVFFCVLVRKQVFDLLGGLSDVFGLGNYEDDDLCFRIRLAGYKLGIAPGAFVFHYGSRTFKEQKIDYTTLMLRNEGIFYDRVANFSTGLPRNVHRSRPPTPAVSVVVRTKDRPQLLRQALLSLANQFYMDFEVVVVNDGGEDVALLLNEFEPYLRFAYVFHSTPHGRAAALNAGVNAAKGRWIAYLDDDDIVYPYHLELLWSHLRQNPEVPLVYADVNKVLLWSDFMGQDLAVVERTRFASRTFDSNTLMVDNWIPIMSFMHSADVFQKIGFFDEQLEVFEDWDLLLRLANLGSFEHIRRVTSEYRFRFGETLGDSTLSLREKALSARLKLYGRYPPHDDKMLYLRDEAIKFSVQQMADVRHAIEVETCDLQRSYLVAAYLGGFSLDLDATSSPLMK